MGPSHAPLLMNGPPENETPGGPALATAPAATGGGPLALLCLAHQERANGVGCAFISHPAAILGVNRFTDPSQQLATLTVRYTLLLMHNRVQALSGGSS